VTQLSESSHTPNNPALPDDICRNPGESFSIRRIMILPISAKGRAARHQKFHVFKTWNFTANKVYWEDLQNERWSGGCYYMTFTPLTPLKGGLWPTRNRPLTVSRKPIHPLTRQPVNPKPTNPPTR
jgi:hypothetical protein